MMGAGLDMDRLWPPAFGAAIFDFDGTLALTADLWREVDEAFLAKRGLDYTPEFPRMLTTLGFAAGAEYCIRRFGLDEKPEDICREWNEMGSLLYRTEVELRPGAEAYLLALRARGVPLALATTNDVDVLRSMEHVDVDALFDVVVCGAEVSRGKDFPDIYVEAARRLGADCADCLVFEDIVPGILSAKSVRMQACGVRSNDPIQDFAAIARVADFTIDGWEEVGLGSRKVPGTFRS